MKWRHAVIVATAALLVAPIARSGHELPVYPSYYPHEIEIATIEPERAGELMRAGKLHTYVGRDRPFAIAPTNAIGAVESLGSFVVVRLNPQSPLARDETSACAATGAMVRDMAARGGGMIVHPYPVTPLHGDYLYHADRAAAARQRILDGDAPPLPDDIKLRAESPLTKSLVRLEWVADNGRWDAIIEEVSASGLVANATTILNGWMGPRWARAGWFHSYRILERSIAQPAHRRQIDAVVERLQTAAYADTPERINLERDLVRALLSGCRAMVAGYTMKREYFNAEFSAGIENIGFDAIEGFNSPIFLRTVKLKDFPWNGWLQLGLEAPPASAWNPVGGFTDAFGRLMWFAIADPAVIPSPYEAAWMFNRISEVEVSPRR